MFSLCRQLYTHMYLDSLRKLLANNSGEYLFPCIVDLVSNGLVLERFTDDDSIPSRQDVTQYIAAWLKYTGLSADECQEWMIEYCIGVLSTISSSSKSQIRHSTKSNIKYIYKSDVAFDCSCEKNRFRATCESTCPIYDEMSEKASRNKEKSAVETYEKSNDHMITDQFAPQEYSKKDKYKDQFGKALEVVQNQLRQGISRKEIVNLLNDTGLKTRTGKSWSLSILGIELRKLNSNTNSEK